MLPGEPITVAQYGLGSIGAEITRVLLSKPWAKLVAAVDIDPAKIGKDVAEVIGWPVKTGVIVAPQLATKPTVVCHSTGSQLRDVSAQLLDLLNRGCHVVSTCEELAFPLDTDMREQLQKAARFANVTLLGTGVNPGFVMDKLALTITSVCQEIHSIEVFRRVDASLRREPLQRKIGAGLAESEFHAALASGTIQLKGLRQSLMMLANGINVMLDEISGETIAPIIAEGDVETGFVRVNKGQVAGVHQTIRGSAKGQVQIGLDIKLYVGARNASDRIVIRGVPDVTLEIAGGIHGDHATSAMVVNAIPRVVLARPGVLTMDDIPISFH